MAATSPVRVIVEIHAREVGIYLYAAGATNPAKPLDAERFGLPGDAPDILQAKVGRDVFDLLYQCANDAVNEATE